MTIQEFKTISTKILKEGKIPSPTPALDLSVLLEFSLEQNKTWILMNRDFKIPDKNLKWLTEAVKSRSEGLPVAYITGHKEFYGYDFSVTPAVLIPKPDTEILVQKAVELLSEKIKANPCKKFTVCDMCTGSGCIGLSVFLGLKETGISEDRLPFFVMADISREALEIAAKNAENLIVPPHEVSTNNSLSHFSFVHTNLFENIPRNQIFDAILTNPPYIPSSMVQELLQDGRREPALALDGDITITGQKSSSSDGLEIMRNLIPQAKNHLSSGGFILIESGEYNATATSQLLSQNGFKNLLTITDLEGQLRVSQAEL